VGVVHKRGLPGADDLAALLTLRDRVRAGVADLVLLDCAPSAETLRLLALPEALTWYMDRVFPAERRLIRAFKPVLTRATGMPMPHERVFDAVERLHAVVGLPHAAHADGALAVRLGFGRRGPGGHGDFEVVRDHARSIGARRGSVIGARVELRPPPLGARAPGTDPPPRR
jgi:hypothetical protein